MNTATLLPNTGIQFIELRRLFRSSDLEAAKYGFSVKDSVWQGIRQQVPGRTEVGDEENYDDDLPRLHIDADARESGPGLVPAQLDVVLEMALDHDRGWLPLPIEGPDPLWAMLWIGRATDGDDAYDGVLAIDTRVTRDGRGGTLAAKLLPETFAIEPVRSAVFWMSEPVRSYIDRHYRRRHAGSSAEDVPLAQSRGGIQAHLAGFYCFLKDLDRIPAIDMRAVDVNPTVDVSLVVDLGNSRTCCALREDTPIDNRRAFHRFEFRHTPAHPLRTSSEPEPTRFVFVPPFTGVLEGAATFQELSISRYGKAALDLTFGDLDAEGGTKGMSSPKRYLWDDARRPDPWQVVMADLRGKAGEIRGRLLTRVSSDRPFEDPPFREEEPVAPDYPRQAGILFMIVEILEQAYRQINSVAFRGQASQPGALRRRVVRNLLVMHPSGMHSSEIKRFHEGVRRAAQLWAEFQSDPEAFRDGGDAALTGGGVVPVPNVQGVCDEGLALQICYLYGETIHRYQSEAGKLIETMGRRRQGRDVLRMASLDIGGGTIDIAVADYVRDTQSPFPKFTMERLFHDGFARGGDDLARAILEQHVFPCIVDQMAIDPIRWNELFCGVSSPAGAGSRWETRRRNLVNSMWQPLIHGCLARIERGLDVDEAVDRFPEIKSEQPIHRLDEQLKRIKGTAGNEPSVQSVGRVRVRLDTAQVAERARATLSRALEQYCALIRQYRCDVLVVGGRPSGLDAIQKIIRDYMPVAPGALVFLHELDIGDWFPFAVDGRVDDSKTCAAVGAALAFASQFNLADFALDVAKERHIPAILGLFNEQNGLFQDDFELFEDDEVQSRPFPFVVKDIYVASRRIDHAHALASPIYKIVLHPEIEKSLQVRAVQNRFHVRVRRREPGSDVISKDLEMQGLLRYFKDGKQRTLRDDGRAVRRRLQTLLQRDYWLDTGCFEKLGDPS